MVVAISSDADVIAPLTMDRLEQARAIAALDPWSTTALHDGIIAALDRLEPEPGRQALVAFLRRRRSLQRGDSRRCRRARTAQPCARLSDCIRQNTTAAACGTGSARRADARFCCATSRSSRRPSADIAHELRYQYLIGYVPAIPIAAGTPRMAMRFASS